MILYILFIDLVYTRSVF